MLPIACKIIATCIDPSGNTVAADTFDFDGNGGVLQQHVKADAKSKGFNGCQTVQFLTTGSVTETASTIITLLDTISYTKYVRAT